MTLRQADSVLEKVHCIEAGDSAWVEVFIQNVLRMYHIHGAKLLLKIYRVC